MYSPHIPKERSYSCLLQLSNIMPLRTVRHLHLMFSIPFLKHVPMFQNVQQEYHTSEYCCITP